MGLHIYNALYCALRVCMRHVLYITVWVEVRVGMKKSARRSNALSLSCSQTYNPALKLVFWKPFAQGRDKPVLRCTIDSIDVSIVSMPVLRVCALNRM